MNRDDVLIGTVVKPHGVDGTLLVEIHTDYPEERFKPGNRLRLCSDQTDQTVTVENASPHGNRWRVKLKESSDRDRAEELRDFEFVVSEDEVIGDGNELYNFDLMDMNVLDQAGKSRGVIEGVSYSGPRPLLEISPGEETDNYDFPAHEDLVIDFDRDESWIQLRYPQGWDDS